jgi:hypothetical protein
MWAEAYEHDERVQARKSDAHAITRGMSMRMRRTCQGSDGFSPWPFAFNAKGWLLGVPDVPRPQIGQTLLTLERKTDEAIVR